MEFPIIELCLSVLKFQLILGVSGRMAKKGGGGEGRASGRRRRPPGHHGKRDKRGETFLSLAAREHRLLGRSVPARAQSLLSTGILSWRFPKSGTGRSKNSTGHSSQLGHSDRQGHGLFAPWRPYFPHSSRLKKFEW